VGGPVGATVLGIGITLRGVNLGYMGLDLSLLSNRPGTSDALYTYDNYAEPVAAPQIHWDIHRWRSSLDTLAGIAKEHDAWLFPGHDETGIQHLDGRARPRTIDFSAGRRVYA